MHAARDTAETKLLDEAVRQTVESEVRRRVEQQNQLRQVQPQEMFGVGDRPAWSFLEPETAEFRALSRDAAEGVIARFVQDRLTLLFWLRPPQAPELVFGCVLDAGDLEDLWVPILPAPGLSLKGAPEFILALLDDKGRPVARSPGDAPDQAWKRPFVATEIGEALPHWEAALYLMKPEQIQASARGWKRTLTFLIAGLLGAIALGGWLVAADARRQMALAQQKTDFVSNVSHELKTPLTSIRMFAELMLAGRPETAGKTPQYLRIIMVEAERLTRLINNVLDFAKLERRQKRIERKPLDLHPVIAALWESQEVHLRESGFSTRWEAAPGPYRVQGDDDALAQILVNLLSNAEKYSIERKEIELQTWIDDGRVHISVLDRGTGIPAGEESKIFEPFYRAHDSLSSGIQGSGLGLTLAQRLAREHGGAITCRNRAGGGSAFTLSLPLSEPPAPA
jgi:signal transduction histidine kinase